MAALPLVKEALPWLEPLCEILTVRVLDRRVVGGLKDEKGLSGDNQAELEPRIYTGELRCALPTDVMLHMRLWWTSGCY